jgi:hypothetical protein
MITKPVSRLANRLYHRSPKENLHHLRGKLFPSPEAQTNDVLDELVKLDELPKLLAWKLRPSRFRKILLLGGDATVDAVRLQAELPTKDVIVRDWDWDVNVDLPSAERDVCVMVCRIPREARDWEAIAGLRRRIGSLLITIGELLLGFTQIFELQSKLGYCLKTPGEILPYYFGERFFGPLQELNVAFPLAGKQVVEFGPFDGCQTAGLVHLGAARVTCIEARAENALKTRAFADAFGFENIRIAMDDFHNATAAKHGRFDLAFAHGVYYHSIAPFVFLNNLVELADAVFIGGFCASDDRPAKPYEVLSDDGRDYRVKRYTEKRNYSAGVNRDGFYFHPDDLQTYFQCRGFQINVISNEPCQTVAGSYLRFLALRSTDSSRRNDSESSMVI